MYQPVTMNAIWAHEICQWNYDAPYDIYSFQEDEETIEELLDGNYYAVLNADRELFGFYCYGISARVDSGAAYYIDSAIDIGLALAPKNCGQGKGFDFLKQGLSFGKFLYPAEKYRFRLTVISWNTRAIKLYQKSGFQQIGSFQMSGIPFIVMLNSACCNNDSHML